jgi:predicted 3-demethylubiquinone-9 3-methyltransferase (glyoxalase superfamily)
MASIQKIAPSLWFDDQTEEAAFYAGAFKNSKVLKISRYTEAGRGVHGRPPGSVMTVSFELEGQPFTALNGGRCSSSARPSRSRSAARRRRKWTYWNRLSAGGEETAQQCGWLNDKYGVSWQVVPTVLPDMLMGPDPAKAGRVMEAMLPMKKLDIAKLKRAYAG